MANASTAKIAREKFHREPKEATTEPKADKLAHEGMKKGGHAKHMAKGGANAAMMGALLQRKMPTRRPAPMMQPQPAMAQPPMGGQPPMKRGGKAHHKHHMAEGGESKAMERKEMREMHKIEKELKHHEHMPARKAHHGLKAGGQAMYSPQIGGLLGEGMPHHKGKTGAGIEGPGFKHGGKIHHVSGHPEGSHEHHKHMAKHHAKMHKESGSAHHKKMHEHHKAMCSGGKYAMGGGVGTMPMVKHGGEHLKKGGHAHKKHHYAIGGQALAAKGDKVQTIGTLKPKVNVQDKVNHTPMKKSLHTKTGGIELEGYKRGGRMHKYAKGGTVSEKVADHYLNDMKDGSKEHRKAGKTGEIHQQPAGYKKGGHVKHHAHGGHVMHHTTHGHHDAGHTHMHKHASKMSHGHDHIDGHPMKKGGKAHHGHSKHHKNY